MTDLIYPIMGAAGFWIGIISGLSMAAVLLCLRLWRVDSYLEYFLISHLQAINDQ